MNAKGFNLFEAMLVCSLVGLLSTLALPLLDGTVEQARLHRATHAFVSALSTARYQAVAKNAAIRIHVSTGRKQFALAEKGEVPRLWQELPRGTQFSSIPTSSPTFYSRGTASPGGSYILSNSAGQIRVVISPTGRVRWERIN